MVAHMDISTYHATSWLPGVLLCSPTTMDFLTTDRPNEHCLLRVAYYAWAGPSIE
jgi:hypothetical protein